MKPSTKLIIAGAGAVVGAVAITSPELPTGPAAFGVATAPSWPPRPSSRRLPPGAPVPAGGWWWPLPPLADDGRKPSISDGLGSPRDGGSRLHHGADVGYWRRKGELPQYVAGTRQASKGGAFVCPDGTPVRAMAAGTIWSVTTGDKGISVVISHGKPYATLTMHLRTCRFPDGTRGIAVAGGETIGTVGNGHNPGKAAPDAYNHPHVEVWYDGGADAYIDPADVLKLARY